MTIMEWSGVGMPVSGHGKLNEGLTAVSTCLEHSRISVWQGRHSRAPYV